MSELTANTKVKIGWIIPGLWALGLALAGGFIWVGSIDAKVHRHDEVQKVESQKLDDVAKTVNTVNGKMDVLLRKLK
jgi:hypothetical protein